VGRGIGATAEGIRRGGVGGVQGKFSRHILQIAKPRELDLVDVWWLEYGEHYPNWGPYSDYGNLKTKDAYNQTIRVVERYGAGKNIVVHVIRLGVPGEPTRWLFWLDLCRYLS
jgi:hypothetical protein